MKYIALEAMPLRDNRWAVRPFNQLGSAGFFPVPWSVQIVRANSVHQALLEARLIEGPKSPQKLRVFGVIRHIHGGFYWSQFSGWDVKERATLVHRNWEKLLQKPAGEFVLLSDASLYTEEF